MDFIHSAVLGLVEGLTEFVPISSSGHLIVARKLMGLPLVGSLGFDAIIQLAAGLAVVCYFWKDIWRLIQTFFLVITRKNTDKIDNNLLWAIVIGTIPAVILGLLLQKYMDTVFRGTGVVATSLIVGSILFYFAEKKFNRLQEIPEKSLERLGTPLSGKDLSGVSIKKGFVIGLYQCLALVPGFSRSGATISGGLLSGLSREMTVRFSFLLSLPIIFGSGLYEVYSLVKHGQFGGLESSLVIASIFSFLSGLLAIYFLIKFLKNHSLNYFGFYRIILAIIILVYLK